MCWLVTDRKSITGSYLYSDQVVCPTCVSGTKGLNALSQVPILGNIAGVYRCALAAIHILGHTIAAFVTLDSGHLKHVAKGFTELLRGIIDVIPVIGQIFENCYSPSIFNSNCASHICEDHMAQFFIIKIINPKELDDVDRAFGRV